MFEIKSINKYTTDQIIARLRNSYGINDEEMGAIRLAAANEIEHWKDAYENMCSFAIENGSNIIATNH